VKPIDFLDRVRLKLTLTWRGQNPALCLGARGELSFGRVSSALTISQDETFLVTIGRPLRTVMKLS
jgi:hypothetical protein